jgi:hypothetical protein
LICIVLDFVVRIAVGLPGRYHEAGLLFCVFD